MQKIAVLDDWQGVAKQSADWSALSKRAQLVFFGKPFANEEERVRQLADFDVLMVMRERSPFPASTLDRLPKLKMIALTGGRTWTIDLNTCTKRKIPVCSTGGTRSSAATAELALGLLIAAARHIPAADTSMRDGRFQQALAAGTVLEGKTLGVVGLGKIGTRMARYGQALGMTVIAWSQNMSETVAAAHGARYVDKNTLLRESDAVSIHVVLSERTRGMISKTDLDKMKDGAILVNASRGPLVDEAAMVERLKQGKLIAGLDVYGQEPLPVDHPLRSLPNTVLTPHQGYATTEIYQQFYTESIENVVAFLDGKPQRMINPEAWNG